jgi:apolipoprotein N-acyltransferase
VPHKPRAKDKRARTPDTGHRTSDNGQRAADQGKVVDPEPESKAAVAEPGVWWLRHRLAAGVVSGLVLWTTFPPMEWGPLAWIALTPLFWLATVVGAPGRTYLAAWAGGLVFWILAVPWLRLIGPGAWIGWIVLGAVFSLWWPLFLALARWARFRLGVPLILAAPIAWVTVEYLRAYFLTGFPWYYLAHSQYRFIHVIQIADVTGSLGVSLLIAMVNAWLVELVTIPLLRPDDSGRSRLTLGQSARLWAVTILVGTTLCYGAYRLSTARFRPGPRVALLQSNLVQGKKNRDRDKILAGFRAMVRRAASSEPRPDLIVWPETAYPFSFVMVAPGLDPATFDSQVRAIPSAEPIRPSEWRRMQRDVLENLHEMTALVGVPMLVGCPVWAHAPDGLRQYNTAVLFQPSRTEYQSYHKMHLVPFGEFIPMIDILPWLAHLTPYRDRIPSLSFGQEPRIFELGPYRFAAVICFEDTIPQVIGRFFRGSDQAHQPDFLVNLSNDGWYPESSELDMHLAIGVFRTIEHRVPLARAVNTGLSSLVDGNGEIREMLPKNKEDVLIVAVPLDDRTTWYSRWGDWLGLSCLAVTIGWIPMGMIRRRRAALRPED